MNRLHAFLLLFVCASAGADVDVAKCTIYTQPGASASDLRAAQELRTHLAQITGANLAIRGNASALPPNGILIGQGPLSRRLFPKIEWSKLGEEQTLIEGKGSTLLVAGGKPRGTLYAVYRLLQVKCGVRWWTPWATTIPKNPHLRLATSRWSEAPAFEYRDPYWFHSFDRDWALRNFDNGSNTRVPDDLGGKIEYQGFVHTYYPLVPPEKLFATHPEWYSLIDGKRTHDNAQLCTTNPELRDYVVEQVRAQLRANPKARIVSVSQNDCFRPCQCAVCRALVAKEGSESALVLDLANFVAGKIEKEFPKVAVDTLAYQWSRHPPKDMKPRKNVIVRLCSIECNFAFPLDAPQNAGFGNDIRGWSKLTNRLYVWDYCTNFAHYMAPHPDYLTLGPTLRFFSQNGVKGVFEEGDYGSNGGDMAELKAWLIAQMLWDPKQDPNRLIGEFLRGYYGDAAAPSIRAYLDLMAKEAQGWNLTFASSIDASFLRFDVMKQAQLLWDKAQTDAGSFGWRVRASALSPEYVWLARWDVFAKSAGDNMPMGSKQSFGQWWLGLTRDPSAPSGWSAIGAVDEGRQTPEEFVKRVTGG